MKQKKTKILFVCLGNICRSPTADAVFKAQIKDAGLEQTIYIDSAGTHAYHIGNPPDQRSQQAALKRGYDMKGLRARAVQPNDFAEFDYILAMDNDNLAILADSCPEQYQHKIGLFMQFCSDSNFGEEVPDPYFGGNQGFEKVLDMVEKAGQGLIKHLSQS